MITRALLNKLVKEADDKQNSTLPEEIGKVSVYLSQPIEERMLQYLTEIKNPYRVRFSEIKINIKYSSDGPSISKLLARYFGHKR